MLSLIAEKIALVLLKLLDAQPLVVHCRAEDALGAVLSDDEVIDA